MSDLERQALPQQGTFDTALMRLEAEFPNDFSGATGGESRTVIFKGALPTGALAILKATGLTFQVKENSGFTDRQLSAAVLQVHSEAVKIYPVDNLMVRPDAALGIIEVTAPMSDATLQAVGAPGSAVDSSAGAQRLHANVLFPKGVALEMRDVAKQPPKLENWGPTGGTRLRLYDGTPWCTSAFTVKSNASADLGPLTASHCGTQLTHDGQFVLQPRAAVEDSRGDVRFFRSPVMEDALFQYTFGGWRPVYTWLNMRVGDVVCNFGYTTGYKCDTVLYTNTCSGSICNLDFTQHHYTAGGDSPEFVHSCRIRGSASR